MIGTAQGLSLICRDFRGLWVVVSQSSASIYWRRMIGFSDGREFHRPCVPQRSLSERRGILRFRDGQGR